MATRKRAGARPRPRPRRGQTEQERQLGLAALEEARRSGLETKQLASAQLAGVPGTGYLSMAEATEETGIDRYRIGEVVRRAGVPVYWSPVDARKKFIKREDLPRLTGHLPLSTKDGGGAEGASDAGGDSGAG